MKKENKISDIPILKVNLPPMEPGTHWINAMPRDSRTIICTPVQSTSVDDLNQYDTLECPECESLCKPTRVLKNGTVVYQKHRCINSNDYSFKIDVNGDLVE